VHPFSKCVLPDFRYLVGQKSTVVKLTKCIRNNFCLSLLNRLFIISKNVSNKRCIL
jgi:hypothetical protein